MCGPKFCSMELTQQVRAAAEMATPEGYGREVREFRERGDVYVPRE